MNKTLMLSFKYSEDLIEVLKKSLQQGFNRIEVLSPIPLAEASQLLHDGTNRLRYFPFFGAITGFIGGFLLASLSAAIYPHPAGGRAIVAIPPYLVIAYECAILLGVISTVCGLLICARLPALKERPYIDRASCDQYILIIQGLNQEQEQQIEGWTLPLGGAGVRLLLEPEVLKNHYPKEHQKGQHDESG